MTRISPFIRGDLDPEGFAKEIARILRSGEADEKFLQTLANLFDAPHRPKGVFAIEVKRRRNSRPKKPHNEALGRAMVEAMKARLPQEKSKDVAARVGEQHNVSWRTAYDAWQAQVGLDEAWDALQKSR